MSNRALVTTLIVLIAAIAAVAIVGSLVVSRATAHKAGREAGRAAAEVVRLNERAAERERLADSRAACVRGLLTRARAIATDRDLSFFAGEAAKARARDGNAATATRYRETADRAAARALAATKDMLGLDPDQATAVNAAAACRNAFPDRSR